jgi:AcrR family transcriptional regulator
VSSELSVPPALQARSRLTQDRIFTAGTRLLEEGGPEALTVAAVAAEAGVSVGSVYRRFGDKERLLGAIQAQFTHDFRTEFEQRVTQAALPSVAPALDVVTATVTGMAETYRAHGPLLRVFMLLGTRNAAVLEQGTRESVEGAHYFRAALQPALQHIRRADVEAAIEYAYLFVDSVCSQRVIHGERPGASTNPPWDELIGELATSVALYLLGSVDRPRSPQGRSARRS